MTNEVINLFDRVADSYDEVLPFFAGFAQEFAQLVPFTAGARVLDLGAGRGALTGRALAAGCRVSAVDAAPAMVGRLAAEYPAADARVMDAERLDFPDRGFDLVVSAFLVHLLADPAAAVREAARVLVPGGGCAFSEPGPPPGTEPAPADVAQRLSAEFGRHLPPGRGRFSRPVDVPALLEQAGFTEVRAVRIAVDLPVPDGETLWRWGLSHGSLAFYESLPADRRAEFRERLLAEAAATPDLRLRREATVWLGRLPEHG
ncbi:class I SAM-dependent methyltransferase [Kitasatospora sp. LaBMicrA B282]|uniref:class I SAM-dependent methyltransferase n=1 Tax=Kitasatospora sp. LaBMicrA B282 TaxID=3420949 RepID=UPI003D0AEDFA